MFGNHLTNSEGAAAARCISICDNLSAAWAEGATCNHRVALGIPGKGLGKKLRKKHGTSYLLGKMRKLRSSQFCFTQKRLIEFQIPDGRLPEIVATPFHLLGLDPTSSVCWDASVKVVWEVAFPQAPSWTNQPMANWFSALSPRNHQSGNPSSDKTWKKPV